MIRVIVRMDEFGKAANVGGSVDTIYKTFDVNLPEVEAWLRAEEKWDARRVIGVELIECATPKDAA